MSTSPAGSGEDSSRGIVGGDESLGARANARLLGGRVKPGHDEFKFSTTGNGRTRMGRHPFCDRLLIRLTANRTTDLVGEARFERLRT